MAGALLSDDWAVSFRASPFRLRFELGGEAFGWSDAPIPRFVQSFGRARQIAHDVLIDSKHALAVVGCWPDTEHDPFAPASDAFNQLKNLGFVAAAIQRWAGTHPIYGNMDDGADLKADWQSFDITHRLSDRDIIIWCAITYESVINPKTPVTTFLVDTDRGILIHIYDDRGMDVIALDRETLTHIYRMHNHWLLEYDRQRIVEAFGSIN